MRKAEIKCITKAEGNADEITHIGGVTSNRAKWKQTIEKTIKEIEEREWEYFVMKDGQHTKIVIATDHMGAKFLTTGDDDRESSFISTLPTCP